MAYRLPPYFSRPGTDTRLCPAGSTPKLNNSRVVAPNRGAASSGPKTINVVRSHPSKPGLASPTSYSNTHSSANLNETLSMASIPANNAAGQHGMRGPSVYQNFHTYESASRTSSDLEQDSKCPHIVT